MKKFLLVFGLSAILFSLPSFARAEGKPKSLGDYDIDKILATSPAQISEEQFYEYEGAIILGDSGSGGYFLSKEEIEWLKSVVAALEAKGIKVKDKNDRGIVFADSYFNMKEYKESIEEYRRIGNNFGAEEAEWFLNNGEIKNGTVKIVEYPGEIPWGPVASETAKTEDKQYLFVAYFKGPVYRYDKPKDKHSIIFDAASKYDWVDSLKWDGKRLMMKCRDLSEPGENYEFNNAKNTLKKKMPHRNIFQAYVEGL